MPVTRSVPEPVAGLDGLDHTLGIFPCQNWGACVAPAFWAASYPLMGQLTIILRRRQPLIRFATGHAVDLDISCRCPAFTGVVLQIANRDVV
jgi:hypothetical protein